jgi:hypothetical protein
MVTARKVAAIIALAVLAGLIVTAGVEPGGDGGRLVPALWGLLVPLLFAAAALLRDRHWGRWLGLAAGLAVVPWAAAFLIGPGPGLPRWRPLLAFGAGAVLLASLTGRAMLERYEGRVKAVDWRGPRMGLVRWTVICNLSSVISLYAFVTAYQHRTAGALVVPGALLAALVAGVLLLARQKTLGLLLVAVSCVSFLPAGGYFVWREAADAGEAVLFAAAFLPGIVAGWACLVGFGRPIVRFLRSG